MYSHAPLLLRPLQVRLAEFNSQPTRCLVTGSASPGLAKERLLAAGRTAVLDAIGSGTDHAGKKTQSMGKADSMMSSKQLLALTMEQLDGSDLIKVLTFNQTGIR